MKRSGGGGIISSRRPASSPAASQRYAIAGGFTQPSAPTLLCGCCRAAFPPLLDARNAPCETQREGVAAGYRGYGWSWRQCALSAFTLHNETLNIHTHLVPAAYFAACTFVAAAKLVDNTVNPGSQQQQQLFDWSTLLFLVAGTAVHGCSAAYHCFGALSAPMASRLLRFDLGGIGLFMLACMINGTLVGFSCIPHLQQIYLATMCCIGTVALLAPFTCTLAHSNLVALYVGVTLSGLVPAIHWVFVARHEERWLFAPRILLFFSVLGVGLFFYLSRWPESRWPGRFDVVGHSHQWWHLCVTLGALSWWDTLLLYREYIETHPCPGVS